MRYLLKIALLTLALALVFGGSFHAAQAKAPPGLGGASATGPVEPGDGGAQAWEALPCAQMQQGPVFPFHREPYQLDSGKRSDGGVQVAAVFQHTIRVPGAPWLRLHFSDYNLGEQSFITMTSLKDGSRQRLDAMTIREWGSSSAYFNGDAVEIELRVAPGEKDIFFQTEEITVGEWVGEAAGVLSPQAIVSLCDGDDDRVDSDDDRVGRLALADDSPCTIDDPDCIAWCTVWIGSNGALMTAGHCMDDDDPPDGVLDRDAEDIVEFHIRNSHPDGTPRFADADDQYPLIPGSIQFHFDDSLGDDWAVFAVSRNPNTGLLPQHAQGPGAFFRLTREQPNTGDDLRVTGCGQDATPPGTTGSWNSDTQTQQTDVGPYQGESASGAAVWHRHRVDTQTGNSGSPMIWEDNGFAIGIHTAGGCNNPAVNHENAGTSFEHDPLEAALDDFPGPNTVYVDNFGGWDDIVTTEDGTIFRPYDLVSEGRDNVPVNGIVSIVAGTYTRTLTIDKAMTLVAPVGHVIIGKGE
jgi:hypothetical protein